MDEAHFSLTINISNKICAYCADKTPYDVALVSLHESKAILCGSPAYLFLVHTFWKRSPPHILNDVSIPSNRYTSRMHNYVIPEVQQRNVINDIVWMQDDAPSRIAISVRQVLQQHFGDSIIAINFAVSWPPR